MSLTFFSNNDVHLLYQFGFGYAWLANEVGDTIAFTKLFKIRVVDCAIQNLNEKVNKSSKTLYYRNGSCI